jgi:hypothetical protein
MNYQDQSNLLSAIMDTSPWDTKDKLIEQLIKKVILENNPHLSDDDLLDTLDDWSERRSAIDTLTDILIKMRKDIDG